MTENTYMLYNLSLYVYIYICTNNSTIHSGKLQNLQNEEVSNIHSMK